MLDTMLHQDRFQKIAQADIKIEQVIILLLEQYQRLLYALEQRDMVDPSINLCISKLLLSISTIQNIRLQKYKLYSTVDRNDFQHYLGSQFAQTETELEQRLTHISRALKKLIIHFDPSMSPNSFYFLNELTQFYTRKRRLFPQMNANPSPPWLHPSVTFIQSIS